MLAQLITIGEFVWLGYFTSMVLFLFVGLKREVINSSLITMAVTGVVVWLMDHYRDFLLSINDEQYKMMVRMAWYIGFVALDALLIFVIYKIHVAFKKPYSLITRIVMLSFFVKALIHLSRLTERTFFTTDWLKPVYQWGIVSINISTAVVILVVAVMAMYQQLGSKTLKGQLWQI